MASQVSSYETTYKLIKQRLAIKGVLSRAISFTLLETMFGTSRLTELIQEDIELDSPEIKPNIQYRAYMCSEFRKQNRAICWCQQYIDKRILQQA